MFCNVYVCGKHGFKKQNTPSGPNETNCLEDNMNAYKIQPSILFSSFFSISHTFLSRTIITIPKTLMISLKYAYPG